MNVIGKDIIITDPCYFAMDADWGETFNYDVYSIEGSFTEYVWDATGYGDGSPKVFSIPTYYNPESFVEKLTGDDEGERDEVLNLMETIGECGVDSGTFGVFLLEEALKYNPNFMNSLPESCYCIIRNFSGSVHSTYDEEGNTHFILKPNNPIERTIITN